MVAIKREFDMRISVLKRDAGISVPLTDLSSIEFTKSNCTSGYRGWVGGKKRGGGIIFDWFSCGRYEKAVLYIGLQSEVRGCLIWNITLPIRSA